MSPGPGSLSRRLRRGAKGAGHYWENLPLPLRIGPIEEQSESSGGSLQEEPVHRG